LFRSRCRLGAGDGISELVHESLYRAVLYAWLLLSAVTFLVLLGRAAPYGRHGQRGWGPTIAARWGWLLMEAPAAIVMPAVALPMVLRANWPQGFLLVGLWALHYFHRAFVFPFRLSSSRPMPLVVAVMGLCFNLVNGWLVGSGITRYGPELGRVALTSPRVLAGSAIFVVGLLVNWDADTRLLRLRSERRERDDRGDGYAIPRGGLYRWVSCPNYLGELIEWAGFTLASGSLAALAFFVWSAANLAPRARAHHRWYRAQFPDYPVERRALLPFVW
jgi:3-oxo-5-alpha-steroid 4-dehydrogenase 1